MNKPLCIELEEATQEIAQAVEKASKEHGLPCYLLVPIVEDLLARLHNGKQRELEEARKLCEAQPQEEVEE